MRNFFTLHRIFVFLCHLPLFTQSRECFVFPYTHTHTIQSIIIITTMVIPGAPCCLLFRSFSLVFRCWYLHIYMKASSDHTHPYNSAETGLVRYKKQTGRYSLLSFSLTIVLWERHAASICIRHWPDINIWTTPSLNSIVNAKLDPIHSFIVSV